MAASAGNAVPSRDNMRNKRIKNPRNLRNPDNSGFLPAIRTRIVLFILHLLSYYFRYCSADSFPVKVLCHRKNSPSVHFYYHTEVYKLPHERAWRGAGRAWRGGDLVHEIPPALISPFPLHQVPRVFSPVAGADLVHEIPPALVLPFPLHQVPRVSSLVAGAVLVHEIPPALVPPFPLHQVPRVSSPAAGRAWCLTTRPCFFVLGHHVPERRRKVMHERLPPAFVHHFSSIIFSKGKN